MKSSISGLLTFVLCAGLSQAANIVGLAPSDTSNLFDAPGGSATVTVATSTLNDGLTMNVTFTPTATDIGRTANAVNLLEIGGNANGTGLYMLGGEIHFLSKMQGVAANVVATFDDLSFTDGNNMIGVVSDFGALTAGTEYSVGVVYDPIVGQALTIAVLPTGGSIFQQTESLIPGTKTNWQGNRTVNAFTSPSNAGAGTTAAGNPFQEGAPMHALDGTAGQALLWNAQGTIIPEPGAFGLLGLSGMLMILRRRR